MAGLCEGGNEPPGSLKASKCNRRLKHRCLSGKMENITVVRPVYVIDVYKLTPSNGPKERSRRARDLTVASDNLSAIEFRPGDFFFNVEPVIRNEATHRKIVFRVGILA
ncbi:hypothetical protein ANN_02537 [Periplaneta americana]|uniref:Uncharacterized protein n=1 Tax=Periplaneta americana TaxID=6978 RepID=A0ABQ8TZ39_PERAM|nr:hypothetical protein ANN_02537 [Periplaneta americana]